MCLKKSAFCYLPFRAFGSKPFLKPFGLFIYFRILLRIVEYIVEEACIFIAERGNNLNSEGITTECRESLATDMNRELYTEKKSDERKGIMKKYFIKANIIAAIPALVLMIFTFLLGITSVLDVLIDIYVGLMTYALVFQLCYPTFIFGVVMPILNTLLSFDGIFSFIGSLVLLPIKIVILVVFWVISPIFYAFGLKERLRCVSADDVSDIPF